MNSTRIAHDTHPTNLNFQIGSIDFSNPIQTDYVAKDRPFIDHNNEERFGSYYYRTNFLAILFVSG